MARRLSSEQLGFSPAPVRSRRAIGAADLILPSALEGLFR